MGEKAVRRLGFYAATFLILGVLLTGFIVYMAGRSSGFWGGGGEEAEAGEGGEEGVDMEGALAIFQERCATCHGASGRGDGPGGASLTPRPRNFTDTDWQGQVDNEHLRRIIVSGGAAVGLSAAMPNNPDLRERPEVVRGLIRQIRSFGRR